MNWIIVIGLSVGIMALIIAIIFRLEIESLFRKKVKKSEASDLAPTGENKDSKDKESSDDEGGRNRYKKVNWVYYTKTALTYLILLSVMLIISQFLPKRYILGSEVIWGWTSTLIILVHIILSIRMVDVDEVAGVEFWGRPLRVVNPGLVLIPLGIFQLRKVTRRVQQREIPAEDKYLYRGEGDVVPEGTIPPLRITHAGKMEPAQIRELKKLYPGDLELFWVGNEEVREKKKAEEQTTDPLQTRLTVEWKYFYRFRIDPKRCWDFFQNIGGDDDLREVHKQLEDTLTSTLVGILQIMDLSTALANQNWVSDKLKINGEKLLKEWGVDLETARVKNPALSKTLNTAILSVSTATLTATAKSAEADGERQRLEKVGAGQAQATLLMLTAEADGLAKRAATAKTEEGKFVSALDTLGKVLPEADLSFFGADALGDIAKVTKVVQQALKTAEGA